MSRPIAAIINTKNLKNNLNIIRKIIYPTKIWFVLKDNAYGHGITNICKFLINADGIAVLTLEEAILLRNENFRNPILLLEGFFHINDLKIIYQYNLTMVIHNKWQLNLLMQYPPIYPIVIYIKINTSMNRLGFNINSVNKIISIIEKHIHVKQIVCMAHFADTSQNTHAFLYEIKLINQILNNNYLRSFANSAAILWHRNIYYDWVRSGILLYGASPTNSWKDISKFNFKPVTTLRSKIIGIQKLYPGTTVSYNYQYYTNIKRQIGIIACGYGDGYPKTISSETNILINGQKTHILGNVTMDMMAIDLINIPHASIGSNVELWGEHIKIDDVATSAKTINYELMCSLSIRVPRILK
ncbi:alanine racemase [Enterobacteriaceae endosymbiont of Macroplea appendiculata]|uniref:alanine racemase n=1 Tax=Enterobacteriaceae endosymbiont of Macroplea appendiculata TaxID=2675790 RepID=UPI00144966C6|nr:alanine racemase [Enterobacteriaceae endosymbiont of Macroplea appendiculata]QJC30651.1 alanine racemase [Enterobacteriaceae endosymbiont of Macroplea appendiculata]